MDWSASLQLQHKNVSIQRLSQELEFSQASRTYSKQSRRTQRLFLSSVNTPLAKQEPLSRLLASRKRSSIINYSMGTSPLKQNMDRLQQAFIHLTNLEYEVHQRNHSLLQEIDLLYNRQDYSTAFMRKRVHLDSQKLRKKLQQLKQKNHFLFVPVNIQDSNVQKMCGNTAFAQFFFQHYPLTLEDEIAARVRLQEPFLQYQVWILLLAILLSVKQSQLFGLRLARLTPLHLLLDKHGMPKVANQLTLPDMILCLSSSQLLQHISQTLKVLIGVGRGGDQFESQLEESDYSDQLKHCIGNLILYKNMATVRTYGDLLQRKQDLILKKQQFVLEEQNVGLFQGSLPSALSHRAPKALSERVISPSLQRQSQLLQEMQVLQQLLASRLKGSQAGTNIQQS